MSTASACILCSSASNDSEDRREEVREEGVEGVEGVSPCNTDRRIVFVSVIASRIRSIYKQLDT